MSASVQESLEMIIDPSLADPPPALASPDLNDGEHALDSHAEVGSNDGGEEGGDSSTPRRKAPKKKRHLVPGSAADFRRREANRLAAERSRSRANEKAQALDNAVKALMEENERLKEELARVDGGADVGAGDNKEEDGEGRGVDAGKVETHQHQDVDGGNSVVGGVSGGDARTTQEQQDSHSRTILAALMQGVDGSFGGDATAEGDWMQGVENLFKDADAEGAGRLGELAAAATGESGVNAVEAGDKEGDLRKATAAEASKPMTVGTPNLATATATAVAVAINAEMEKIIRDDLASTKASVLRLEKEIRRIREEGEAVDPAQDVVVSGTNLPAGILDSEVAELQRRAEEMQGEIERLEVEIPRLREEVVREVDGKVGEEERVSGLVRELQELLGLGVVAEREDQGDSSKEEERVKGLIKGVSALLGAAGIDLLKPPSEHLPTYSSPAIARRRRGRPPKESLSQLPSLPTPHVPSSTPTGKRQPRTRSKLSQQVANAQDLTAREAGAGGAGEDEVHTAEAYILSHLAQAQQAQDEHEQAVDPSGVENTHPMDSSSFAELMPPSGVHDDEAPQMDEAEGGEAVAADGGDALQQQPNVLSRLKKGVPGSCDICGRTETSVWRKLVLGGEEHKVCNACGLYHTKFGVIRPPELWGDGKGIRKRRVGPRASRGRGDEDAEGRPTKKQKKGGAVKKAEEPLEGEDESQQQLLGMEEMQMEGAGDPVEEGMNLGMDLQVGDVGLEGGVGGDEHSHQATMESVFGV